MKLPNPVQRKRQGRHLKASHCTTRDPEQAKLVQPFQLLVLTHDLRKQIADLAMLSQHPLTGKKWGTVLTLTHCKPEVLQAGVPSKLLDLPNDLKKQTGG